MKINTRIEQLAEMVTKDAIEILARKITEIMRELAEHEVENFYDDVDLDHMVDGESRRYYARNYYLYNMIKELYQPQSNGVIICGLKINADDMDKEFAVYNKGRSPGSIITPDQLFDYTLNRGWHGWHEHKGDMNSRVQSDSPVDEIIERSHELKAELDELGTEAWKEALKLNASKLKLK